MRANIKFDSSVYLVFDPGFVKARSFVLEEFILRVIEEGVTMLQLREKTCSQYDFLSLAKRIKKLLIDNEIAVPFIINDRVHVAKLVDVDGVHVGQGDLDVFKCREILGERKIIGYSVERNADLAKINYMDIDYLGVSGIFYTPSKNIENVWGVDELNKLRKLLPDQHLVAIGGINKNNVRSVIQSGADGVAIISAILSSDDPFVATKEMAEIVKDEKRKIRRY